MKRSVLAACLLMLSLAAEASADPVGKMETVEVTGRRVKIADVIAAIGRRMEYSSARQVDYAFTSLTTVISHESPDRYSLQETATRFHHDQKLGDREVQLWARTRKYKDGELTDDNVDTEISADFVAAQEQVIGATPFAPGGADHYAYQILAKQVVGNSLVYKIGFAPKNRFEALPTGVIWVDYSNWAVRKMEASMTGAVPYPMFLKGVPVYRLSQERFGEFWFPTEMYLELKLRRLPFLPVPESVEVRVTLQDVEINGEALIAGESVPDTLTETVSEADIAAGFWLSAPASEDSLAAFWGRLSDNWEMDIAPELEQVTLPASQLDSLTAVGVEQLGALAAGHGWRVDYSLLQVPEFNRVQGVVPRFGLVFAQRNPVPANFGVTVGYGFANKQLVMEGELDLPLLRSHWVLPPLAPGQEPTQGAPYEKLGLRLSSGQDGTAFGGDNRARLRSASAFLYGSDPNHYAEKRWVSGIWQWRFSRALTLTGGGGLAAYRAWSVHQRWNVWGRSLHPDINLAADEFEAWFVHAGVQWHRGGLRLAADFDWHDLNGVALRDVRLEGELAVWDRFGNRWRFSGSHRRFDRGASVPLQWKSWLGDYGSLRGYGAGELTGNAGMQLALDARFGFDLWRGVRMPVLKNMGLQPLGFVDWGRTWDPGGADVGAHPGEGARGWRADVGFGFGKQFDLPGMDVFHQVRIYAAHPVLEGSGGRGWRVLLAFER